MGPMGKLNHINHYRWWVLCGMVLWLLSVSSAQGDAFPRPIGAVNDFAGVLSPAVRDRLENLAREVWSKARTAVVVAIMPTIGDNEINDYVNQLYSAWGIGEKGKDRGVLIFVTVKERRMRIETGYGVEGILPDGLVGEIRDRYMIPYLKAGDYDTALWKGTVAIATIIAQDAGVTISGAPTRGHVAKRGHLDSGSYLVTWIVLLALMALLLGTRTGRRMVPWLLLGFALGGGRGGSHYSGGGFGGFGGGFGGFGGGMSGGGGAGGSF